MSLFYQYMYIETVLSFSSLLFCCVGSLWRRLWLFLIRVFSHFSAKHYNDEKNWNYGYFYYIFVLKRICIKHISIKSFTEIRRSEALKVHYLGMKCQTIEQMYITLYILVLLSRKLFSSESLELVPRATKSYGIQLKETDGRWRDSIPRDTSAS